MKFLHRLSKLIARTGRTYTDRQTDANERITTSFFLFCIQLAVSPSYEIERSASQKDYRLVIGLKLLTS